MVDFRYTNPKGITYYTIHERPYSNLNPMEHLLQAITESHSSHFNSGSNFLFSNIFRDWTISESNTMGIRSLFLMKQYYEIDYFLYFRCWTLRLDKRVFSNHTHTHTHIHTANDSIKYMISGHTVPVNINRTLTLSSRTNEPGSNDIYGEEKIGIRICQLCERIWSWIHVRSWIQSDRSNIHPISLRLFN